MSKPPNRPDDPNRPNTKRTGERSEAAFLYQASQRRFAICKPWGDSERYDFILDNRPNPKSTSSASRSNAPTPSAPMPTKPARPTP
jgi:hypothetical protein